MINRSQSQLEPLENPLSPLLPQPQPQPPLPKQLKIRISQIREQLSPPLKNPALFPHPQPQSLLPQPVAAKSLIICLHIFLIITFDLYYVLRLVWFHILG